MTRRLLVHLHMFKNAGTTVDSALQASFGDGFLSYDGAGAAHRVTPEEFRELVVGRPGASAITSHQLRLPLPPIPEVELMPMAFFREPLDRAQSVWSFERRQRSNSPGARHAKELSVDGYVRWRLGQGAISVISDFQTGVIGRNGTGADAEPELAARRLGACSVVGVVERMTESMLAAEHTLSDAFPAIDLSFVSRNVTPGRAESARERVDRFFGLLGPSLAEELQRRNARDIELHALANRELDRRLAAIPELETALEGFRRRCLECASP